MESSFWPETNWVDIIVIIFLIRGIYIGSYRGFSVELFKSLGAIATAVLTLLYYDNLGDWLASRSFLSLQVANFISAIILVFSLLFVFTMVRILVFRILHLELFGGLEKWGGITLGIVRSVIFVSLFLYVLTFLPGTYIKRSIEERSLSGPYVRKVAPEVFKFIVRFNPKDNNED